MRRRLRRTEDRLPHALRVFGGELAAAEDGSLRLDATARAIPKREDARVAREKCAPASDRPVNGFAGELSAPAASIDRNDRPQRWPDADSRFELWRAARDHRRDQKPAAR